MKKEDVIKMWTKFIGYTKRAEQHEFPFLAACQMKMEPLYNDLLENWDERHAELWAQGMNMIFDRLGI